MGFEHFKLGTENTGLLEFSHYAGTYPKGWWRKENEIVLDHCKMNVFVAGEFSLFAGNSLYEPKRGDAFFAEPVELHWGNIAKETFIEYYQLDFDARVFEKIPHGKEFFSKLVGVKRSAGIFLKTQKQYGDMLIKSCAAVEEATAEGRYALAFARCVELMYELLDAYGSAAKAESAVFSHTVSEAIRFADEYSGGKLGVSEAAKYCGVSESYLLRQFKAQLGETPSRYFMKKRLVLSTEVLDENCNISDVAAQFGFSDASHYIACFKRCFSCTPREYAKRKSGKRH